jgi:prepilin-type N-terminal cleavage/methylation domain-containing protein
MMTSRRGVTLIELLIAMVIAVIVGGALLSLLMSSNRFQERTESQRAARGVARSAVNALVSDLRMVDPEWGVTAASGTSITVRVPYAMGLVCSSTASAITAALLPVDSVALGQAGFSGYATRGSGGAWGLNETGLTGVTVGTSWPTACTTAGVQQLTAPSGAPNAQSRPITIAGSTMPVVTAGTPILLYRRVRYYFGASAQTGLTGRTALWRDYLDDGAGAVELAAPFDATAAFRFYVLAATTPVATAPIPITNIHGLQLFLPGESDRTARTRANPEQADFTTSVFFVNRRS